MHLAKSMWQNVLSEALHELTAGHREHFKVSGSVSGEIKSIALANVVPGRHLSSVFQWQFSGSGVCRSDSSERSALAYVAITLRCDEPGLSHVNMVSPVGWSIDLSMQVI